MDDPEKLKFQGSLTHSINRKYLQLTLKKVACDGDECATDQEIDAFIRSNFTMFRVLASTVTFDQEEYQGNPIVRSTQNSEIPVEFEKYKVSIHSA